MIRIVPKYPEGHWDVSRWFWMRSHPGMGSVRLAIAHDGQKASDAHGGAKAAKVFTPAPCVGVS